MKFLKKILRLLPISFAKYIIRYLYDVTPQPPTGVIFKIAETKSEFKKAFQLVQDSYKDANLADKKDPKLRVTKYHALPTTTVFIAKLGDRIIATSTIITKINFKLPLEELFDISAFENKGRISEVSSLAIAKDFRKQAGKLSIPLMVFMFRYSLERLGNNFMLICINPSAAIFYEALFAFKPISKEVKSYGYVNGAKAFSMYLDMKLYAKNQKNFLNNFHRSLVKIAHQDYPFMIFPSSKYYFPLGKMLNNELFNYFFFEKTSVFNQLSDTDKLFLRKVYNISNDDENSFNEDILYLFINGNLFIGEELFNIDIVSISKKSITCRIFDCKNNFENNIAHLKLDLSRYDSLLLDVEIVPLSDQILLNVLDNLEWNEYIDYLKSEINSTDLDVKQSA